MWAQSAAEIGRIIVAGRRYRKLTQSELARAIGTTQTWISEVERGKETAQIGLVLRALSHLGIRLRTGSAPWEPGEATATDRRRVSLSDVISAHAAPKSGAGK
jgi:y4mF family transcriptional regulator